MIIKIITGREADVPSVADTNVTAHIQVLGELVWISHRFLVELLSSGILTHGSQKIKQLLSHDDIEVNETTQKIALMGALTLYLDFINLFIYLLRILGDRK